MSLSIGAEHVSNHQSASTMAQKQEQHSPFLNGVDDAYFSALFDDDEQQSDDPISDDKYAYELQFQEAIMSSLISSQQTIQPSSLVSPSSLPTPSSIHCFSSSSSKPSSSRAFELRLESNTEKIEFVFKEEDEESAGDSSPFHVMCEICAETKEVDQMFRNKRCDHSFCSECVTRQVATKIQENISVVACPGLNCRGVLELDACRPMLPKELVDRWNDALCEALFLTAPKFYCPFKDCSAMLLDDNGGGAGGAIAESECPFCHRLFCARCSVPWHPGVGCEEFQSLNEDERGREDLLVRELANKKNWRRCPRCKFYVEKNQGCLHITCRCRFEFCYACGAQWSSTHGGCQRI